MKSLTIRQARQALSHLDEILTEEGELTITNRGRAVARIITIEERSIPSHRDLRQQTGRMKKGSEKLLREDRDAR